MAEYRLDAAYLLGSRLEIQILKSLKAGFHSLYRFYEEDANRNQQN